MDYIKETLTPNEVVEYRTKPSEWYFLPFLVYGMLFLGFGIFLTKDQMILISGITFAVGVMIISWVLVQFFTTEIAVTNKRVICKVGLISRKTTEIARNKVESVDVEQGILGRLCHYGNVRVFGTGTNVALMKGIHDPLKFRAAVMKD